MADTATSTPQLATKSAATSDQAQTSGQITPDLVRAVADRVYAMLLADLRIENERLGPKKRSNLFRKGGW